jgi:SAM-dependent methyltransferase
MAVNVRELAACPEGQLGVAAADLMAQINEGMYRRVLTLLPPYSPGPRKPVLEIGYGAGAMRFLLKQTRADIKWVGLEKSHTMHEMAARLPGYEVQHGVAECLPFDDARFVSVIALNTLCWWDEPMVALAEIRRVLMPTGWLIVSLLLPNAQARALELQEPPAPRYYTPLQVNRMLKAIGLFPHQTIEDSEQVTVEGQTTTRAYQLIVAVRGPRR